MNAPYGFRIVGKCVERRRLVTWLTAFHAHAACDHKAEVDREVYLSAFTFGHDFRTHLEDNQSPKGFDGLCWAPWVWFDIDRENAFDTARRDAAILAHGLMDRYALRDNDLLVFFSGDKGFHLGLPTWLWLPEPSGLFNKIAKTLAVALAESLKVTIDVGVYDKVRPFRAPNSRHSKTGLHKRQLELDELTYLSANAIRTAGQRPRPFDVAEARQTNPQAVDDWHKSAEQVQAAIAATKQRQESVTNASGMATLNRATREFIINGASIGDRHRLLFSAAANLAEFGCTLALAKALLGESALDSGLTPSDVHRQIACGLAEGGKKYAGP